MGCKASRLVSAEDQLKFGKRWTAIAGGRYDRYDSVTMNRLNGVRTIIDQNAFTGRLLSLVYDAGNGLFPYISYDDSFEGFSGSDRYGNTFEPTTGRPTRRW
ncbi:TonB-dependent receptor domain-containing protein [Pelosinus fermentans]|uniref:TonB-dependent receptor domain-containing protein n=1 Tax=Pelosinus fermentans TaxID=365349 RepID=UPI00090071E9|nr:TonB-dependent receptor [Pelosinus fermentans]